MAAREDEPQAVVRQAGGRRRRGRAVAGDRLVLRVVEPFEA
jgi:hypothetical protein